jgi:hypothetical protein
MKTTEKILRAASAPALFESAIAKGWITKPPPTVRRMGRPRKADRQGAASDKEHTPSRRLRPQ